MLQVPFFRPSISDAEVEAVAEVLRSGWLTSGPKVKQFEQEFAQAVGGEHAVAVNSCTAALHLSLLAMGLKPGDCVLVPTMTFAATGYAVCYHGATPFLVDCDRRTFNMELEDAVRMLLAALWGELPA
ncbi:MAG: aminotransferase class I/II-fold pyridoxal phosphate-dependent enzyme, partial [Planctomycetales bacterium]